MLRRRGDLHHLSEIYHRSRCLSTKRFGSTDIRAMTTKPRCWWWQRAGRVALIAWATVLLYSPCSCTAASKHETVRPASSLLFPKEYRISWASFRQHLQAADAAPPQESHPDNMQVLNSELTAAAPSDAYAAICIINRDQHEDLLEWVAYHQRLGFKLYVFDDGSVPPLQNVLEDYIAMGVVNTFYVRESTNPLKDKTMAMYESCLQLFGHRHKFLGFLDVDEFFVIRDGTPDAATLLQDFEGDAGLAINWLTFGSSGRHTRPKGGVLQNYAACVPAGDNWNKHVRFFVDPKAVFAPKDAHTFIFREGKSAVTPSGLSTAGPYGDMHYKRVAIHHYVVKSQQDFNAKLERGAAHGQKPHADLIDAVDRAATQACISAVPIGEQIAQTILGQ